MTTFAPLVDSITSKAFATTKISTRNSRACCVITGWKKRNTKLDTLMV
jgi:hypothetical protein